MVDYSKWKKIEISDDEDDTHPNIDTASLFRWRHDARLQRMAEQEKDRGELDRQVRELRGKLAEAGDERANIEKQIEETEKKLADLVGREKKQPWNVDTISHDSWSNTLINRKCLSQTKVTSSEEEYFSEDKLNKYSQFVGKHESKIKEFAFHSRFDDCRWFLLENPEIVSEHTLDYMSLWCMQLQIEKKTALLDHVSRQTVVMQMLIDLAKTANNVDPRSCLPVFFTRAKQNYAKFQALIEDELVEFRKRVNKAAEMRIEKALEEQEKDPQKLIGPGGLDAQEVFESLPAELQKCFETRDPEMLRETLAGMEKEDAEYHMQRCVDAGLWTPNRVVDEDEQLYQKVMERKLSCLAVSDEEGEDEVD